MTKEELNQLDKTTLTKEITKLKDAVEQHQEQVKDLQHDLNVANIRLEDIDKPKLTSRQFEDLHCAIEQGIDEFDFDNSDNYDLELSIGYENEIEIERVGFKEQSELVDMVIQRAESVFGVADEKEDKSLDEILSSE